MVAERRAAFESKAALESKAAFESDTSSGDDGLVIADDPTPVPGADVPSRVMEDSGSVCSFAPLQAQAVLQDRSPCNRGAHHGLLLPCKRDTEAAEGPVAVSQGMAESHGSDGNDLFLTDDDGRPRTDATDELRDEARSSGGALESSQTPVTQGAPRRKVTWDASSTTVADKTEPHGDEWYQTERLRDEPESYSFVLPDLEFKASVKTTHEELQRCEDWIRWHRERLQEREAGPQRAS